MELKGKKVVIVGLAKTGWDVANFLLEKGVDIYVTEEKKDFEVIEKAEKLKKIGIKVELGFHSEKFLEKADIVIPSPGVSPESLPIKWAIGKKVPLISEIELSYLFSPSKKIIAITGTNGKTTTTSLCGFLFKNACLPYVICGNIGNTFIGEIKKIKNNTWIILEVSSFQLEYIDKFKPYIGVLLNITPDHLDRYPSMEEYINAKFNLFKNQTEKDWAVLNYKDFYCREIASKIKGEKCFFSINKINRGVFLKNQKIVSDFKFKGEIISIKESSLFGLGNIYNMLAVTSIGLICDINPEIIRETFKTFKTLPHRLEKVYKKNGIVFINDSKATNVDAVKKALESFPQIGKIILIMGGKDKGFSFKELSNLVRKKVKNLILLGETKEKIAKDLKKTEVNIDFVDNMKQAVNLAFKKAKKGDIILLSPGCSSFDMFKNYQERGDVFKKEVKSLL